jgi:hypothetical protein
VAEPCKPGTAALTPDLSSDPDDAVDAFLNKAFCG